MHTFLIGLSPLFAIVSVILFVGVHGVYGDMSYIIGCVVEIVLLVEIEIKEEFFQVTKCAA